MRPGRIGIGGGLKQPSHLGHRYWYVGDGLNECSPAKALPQFVRPVQQALQHLSYPNHTPVEGLHSGTQPRQGQ